MGSDGLGGENTKTISEKKVSNTTIENGNNQYGNYFRSSQNLININITLHSAAPSTDYGTLHSTTALGLPLCTRKYIMSRKSESVAETAMRPNAQTVKVGCSRRRRLSATTTAS